MRETTLPCFVSGRAIGCYATSHPACLYQGEGGGCRGWREDGKKFIVGGIKLPLFRGRYCIEIMQIAALPLSRAGRVDIYLITR